MSHFRLVSQALAASRRISFDKRSKARISQHGHVRGSLLRRRLRFHAPCFAQAMLMYRTEVMRRPHIVLVVLAPAMQYRYHLDHQYLCWYRMPSFFANGVRTSKLGDCHTSTHSLGNALTGLRIYIVMLLGRLEHSYVSFY